MKGWVGRGLVAGALMVTAATAAAEDAAVKRGEYLVRVMDCSGCHTPGALRGQPDVARRLAGSDVGFGTPPPPGGTSGGVVYPTNLTPDRDTGLGAWSDEQIIQALRQGRRPDGRMLVPVMPWPAYAALTDDDARAIVAYLRTIPAVRNQVAANVAPGQPPTNAYLKVIE